MSIRETATERAEILAHCRALFADKLHDYGAAWRIMRASSLTDQIYIKAARIRTIETTGVNQVGESIESELIGIVNYGLIALIQLELGAVDRPDMSAEEALERYDQKLELCLALMDKKNHDYGEAWRQMRLSSITDLILSKLHRTKQIEELGGATLVSEGLDANYMDMINYAIFALIKLKA